MSLHPPKQISSTTGLGLHTKKSMRFIKNNLAIGTEVWGKIDKPWVESGTVIASQGYTWITKWEAGRPYIITNFYNDLGVLVGTYCDVSRGPVQRLKDEFIFDDLYLDVWKTLEGTPVILDEDELEQALNAKFITNAEAQAAQRTAEELAALINSNSNIFEF